VAEFSLKIPEREDVEHSGFDAYEPPETVELDSHSLECNWRKAGQEAVKEVVIVPVD